MKLNFIRNKKFIQIALGLLVVIIIALIGFNFRTIQEGLTNRVSQCSLVYDCASCTKSVQSDSGVKCLWKKDATNKNGGECGSFTGPSWSSTCPTPPTPAAETCAANTHRIGCLLENGCAWDNGKCRIDDQPGFDKCAGNSHCIPCIISGCYWSKIDGCSKTKLDATYSRTCKDLIAPDQEKCAKHTGCKMCVQDGCLWGSAPGYTPNCISPDTEHSETDYSRNCLQNDSSTTETQ
jgi:hypothetical protein